MSSGFYADFEDCVNDSDVLFSSPDYPRSVLQHSSTWTYNALYGQVPIPDFLGELIC